MSYEVTGASARPDALRRCVGDLDAFLRDHWGQRPLLHRGEARDHAELLSLDDVDHLLTRTSPRTPTFRLVRGGAAVPRSSYTRPGKVGGQRLDDLPDPGRVLALFHDGATIALQGLHRWWPPVAALCRDIESVLTHPLQANAYVTPPGSRGLDVHHDTHDVLALQTEGHKHWVVHEPAVPLALPRQRWNSAEHDPGPLVVDTELRAGDALYLPRGTPHAAETTDSYSVHLTIGIRTVTWQDVLERAIRLAGDELRFREALPWGFAADPARLREELSGVLRDAGEWLAGADTGQLARDVVHDHWRSRQPDLRAALLQTLCLDEVDDDSIVRPRPGPLLVDRSEDRVAVILGDRTVSLPAAVEPALQRLLAGPLAVADLADLLDAASRRVLVRRLLREGIVMLGGHVGGDPGDA